MSVICRVSRLIAILCTMTISPAVMAQPAGSQGDDFIHRIQPNDTLIALADRYTRNNSNWTVLQQHNAIANPSALPIGLELKIPFPLIPEVPASATAIHVSGNALVDGAPLRTGMSVSEGSTISTSPNVFVTLQLSDGTKVALPRGERTHLERLREFEGLGLTDSIVRIENGDIDSNVAPSGQGVGRFEVRTPVAIIGVRGTRFRINTANEALRSEILHGAVNLKSQAAQNGTHQQARIAAGHGAAVSADGTITTQPLLPAPELAPAQRTGSGQWTSLFTPVPGATAYLVQVSRDREGLEVVSSQQFDDANIRFSARRPGTHYASVRAISSTGLGGGDTVVAFEGSSTLNSSSGTPITLSDGSVVTLTDY
jgi:hypothetical protein